MSFAPAIKGLQTFQDTDDPNSIGLVIDVKDMDLLGAIIFKLLNLYISLI